MNGRIKSNRGVNESKLRVTQTQHTAEFLQYVSHFESTRGLGADHVPEIISFLSLFD